MRIDVAELRRRLGERRHISGEVVVEGLEVAEVAVAEDVPVRYDAALESVSGGVEVVGSVTGRWRAPCRRCLEPIEGPVDVALRELFEDEPTEGETYPIEHEGIDLIAAIRDALVSGLPLAPLCRADCPGPDPAAYPVGSVDQHDESHDERPRDPRWAALDVLRGEFPDSDSDDDRG